MGKLFRILFLWAALAAFCLLLCGAANGESIAFTEDGWSYELTEEGGVRITGCSLDSTELEFPAELGGRPVKEIGDVYFEDYKVEAALRKIVIPEGVEVLGKWAFRGFKSLEEVILPSTLKRIEAQALAGIAAEPGTIQLPEGVELPEYEPWYFGRGRWGSASGEPWRYAILPDGTAVLTELPYTDGPVLNLPQTVDDIPVTSVCLLSGGSVSFTEVNIPEGYISICEKTFDKNGNSPSLTAVTLPSSLKYIGPWAFNGHDQLTNVEFPEGLEVIEAHAFGFCGLKQVRLLPGLKRIGDRAFDINKSLRTIELPDGLETIGANAFELCSAKIIVIPASVRSVGDHAFAGSDEKDCTVRQAVIAGADTALGKCVFGITCVMGGSYTDPAAWIDYYAEPVRDLSVPELKLTCEKGSAADRLYQYNVVKEYDVAAVMERIRSGLGKTVESGGYEYILQPDGTASVFKYPIENGAAVIPGELDGIPVTSVGKMFEYEDEDGRNQVKKLTVGEGVLRLEQDAFYGFGELASVSLPSTLEEIGGRAFGYCNKLKSVTLPENLKTIGDQAFFLCPLKSVCFPEGLETIGAEAFRGCPFKELVFPASLTAVGDEAFAPNGRQVLKKVTFLGADTAQGDFVFGYVTYGEDRTKFGYYSSPLASINKVIELNLTCLPGSPADEKYQFNVKKQYPKWDGTHIYTAPEDRVLEPGLLNVIDWKVYELVIPEGVEEISDNAFAGVGTLVRVSLPSTLKVIGRNAFKGCFALAEISLPKGLTTLGASCFEGCLSLKEISIPDGVEEIPDRAFCQCFRLAKLTLPDGLKAIGQEAFAQEPERMRFVYDTSYGADQYSALKTVKLPAGLQRIGGGAFACCDALTAVTFAKEPNLVEIGEVAFSMCVRLKKIALPDGLASLGNGVFMYNYDLASLSAPDSLTQIGDKLIEHCPLKLVIICGKDSAMEKYMQERYSGITIKYSK